MYEKWFRKHTKSLAGKTVAVSGATGGIGQQLCRHLARLGASLILLDRNKTRSSALADELRADFDSIRVQHITVDMADVASVKHAAEQLKAYPVDILIHNAGAYSIPRRTTAIGVDNVFQINFVSPYYLTAELLPLLQKRHGHVVAVASIAHRYSRTDPNDPDFSTRKAASKVYGNAKRHIMLSFYELFKEENAVTFAVVHPGITFTNITAHYPKWLFAVIKHPMKILFMRPATAALSIVKGVFTPCKYLEWIGPALFDVWGLPKTKRLHGFCTTEIHRVSKTAQNAVKEMKECVTSCIFLS